METNAKIAMDLRLTEEEFELIKKKLGRTPNFTELCAFSGMWSEHCSYKNSIKLLKTLPRSGGRMLVAAGEENAGLMDIGDGYAVVFKVESHNHPSAIEPFQGAATGVGGILRDIFTMGARPIASLNSLRFGKISDSKTRRLMDGIVRGIGFYGNCFGVPTVGGEVYFDPSYHSNPMVNAMSVGTVKIGKTISAIALGKGNTIFIVGSATGKDGIGGASFASANITDKSHEDLPAVQVGDPFQEKKLLEACLELAGTEALVGMQDMGAAGIICSCAEMSEKGGVGMHFDLDKVPTRQKNLEPWELLLSESQERMLMCVKKGQEDVVLRVFEKWDLPCCEVGYVTDDGILSFYMNGKLEASLPAAELVLGGGAPQYSRDTRKPAYLNQIAGFRIETVADVMDEDLKGIAEKLIQEPDIADKRWVTLQYDSMVGTANLTTNAPSDAALVLVKETGKVLSITMDCNSAYVYADPYVGGMIAVAEAARNVVCSGGEPIGVTDCLNFGNPYDAEVYYQFEHAIKGIGEACRKFDTPVTGGNVSFYNQNPDGPVYPTPVIGMVGLLDTPENKMTLDFKQAGDHILLLGHSRNDLGSSEYLRRILGISYSQVPYFEIEEELNFQKFLKEIIRQKKVQSVHDVSEGGLMVCLLESAMAGGLGFSVSAVGLSEELRRDAFWFGEAQSRALVSVSSSVLEDLKQIAVRFGVPVQDLGNVTSDANLRVEGQSWGNINSWKQSYLTSIEEKLK